VNTQCGGYTRESHSFKGGSVNEINPLDLPSVPLGDRKNLPDCPAIYFVLDSNDAVLYVGRAISLARRWVAHHRTKQLREGGPTRIAWLEVSDSALLDEIERACIAYFAPSMNGSDVVGVSHPVLLRVPLHLYQRFQAEARRRVLADATTILQLARERLDQIDGGD